MVSYNPVPVPAVVEAHLIINIVVLLATMTVVGLRIVSRNVAGSKLGWDDYLTLLSVPQGIGMVVMQGLCMLQGSRVLRARVRVNDLLSIRVPQGPQQELDTIYLRLLIIGLIYTR